MTPVANFAPRNAGVVDTGGKFSTGVNDTGGMPPVSTTQMVKIVETISDSLYLKVILKEKIYLYVNSATQRCPNKANKTFLIEDFFHLPPQLNPTDTS
jgi:hypothetical protein